MSVHPGRLIVASPSRRFALDSGSGQVTSTHRGRTLLGDAVAFPNVSSHRVKDAALVEGVYRRRLQAASPWQRPVGGDLTSHSRW